MSLSVPRYVVSAIKLVLAIAALGYAGALGVLYASQERLIFPATVLPADFQFRYDLRFEELRIPVAGASLDALHFTQPQSRGLVFFLHGNAGNLSTWTTGVDFYRKINYDLFIFDYRGYGKSTGRIESEAQLHADVRAAWDAIAPHYPDKPIVIYGRSLGTGLATYLAREIDPHLLILVSPYSSLAAAARQHYPLAPEWLLKYPLRSDNAIGDVRSPIMLIHGAEDDVIPPAQSVRLKALARVPAELVIVQGAGHNDIHTFPAYLDALSRRLTELSGS